MAGARFQKQLRLLDSAQFKAVFDGAETRVSLRELLVLARPNALDHPRLGIVVGKKNCRLASSRNRVKRLIRESYRHHQEMLAGLDIIVLARRGIADLDNATISRSLAKSWTRLGKAAQQTPSRSCDAPASP
ncbi:MAG: ribonuclease P protein component [Pseudomonadales bacterium]|jgi:ribonuclease P protein component|nr:ribonuclease P protein component [Pseudomonadales bacterium]MCP5337242.1 ribonuclease P protein component [Pseudomonadales bacterium]